MSTTNLQNISYFDRRFLVRALIEGALPLDRIMVPPEVHNNEAVSLFLDAADIAGTEVTVLPSFGGQRTITANGIGLTVFAAGAAMVRRIGL